MPIHTRPISCSAKTVPLERFKRAQLDKERCRRRSSCARAALLAALPSRAKGRKLHQSKFIL